MHIYHIALERDWAQAIQAGEYTISTLGRTLAEQGSIHASDEHQVAAVANFIYGSHPAKDQLIVLVIDVDRLVPEVRYEHVPGADDPFPHIYGPLNTDAVVATTTLDSDPSGLFRFRVPRTFRGPDTDLGARARDVIRADIGKGDAHS